MKSVRCKRMAKPFPIIIAACLFGASLPAQTRKLDTTSFVVLGEGLAAGMGNFSLSLVVQERSFPARMAEQMGTLLVQPMIQPPGIGNVPGFPALPPRVPVTLQTTLRVGGPSLFVQNLSVPGLRLKDAVTRRPQSPLIHRGDSLQTSINLILGFPAMLLQVDGQTMPGWSQLEYARNLFPTLALIELGYHEMLEAAVASDPALLPEVAAFKADYAKVVAGLRSRFAEVIASTIPDPLSTAFFLTVPEAVASLRSELFILLGLYELAQDDLITIPGLNEISAQFLDRKIMPLPANAVLRRNAADAISARVKALNAAIAEVAQQNGAVVYDLNAFFGQVDTAGVVAAGRILTGRYMGGFYQLNGYYPGVAGHALIANDALALLNRTYGTAFKPVDVAGLLADDPAVNSTPVPTGPAITLEELLPGLTINGAPVDKATLERLRALQKAPEAPGAGKGTR